MIERDVTIVDCDEVPNDILHIFDEFIETLCERKHVERVDKICKYIAGHWANDPDSNNPNEHIWINTPEGIVKERSIRDFCKSIDVDPSKTYIRFDF